MSYPFRSLKFNPWKWCKSNVRTFFLISSKTTVIQSNKKNSCMIKKNSPWSGRLDTNYPNKRRPQLWSSQIILQRQPVQRRQMPAEILSQDKGISKYKTSDVNKIDVQYILNDDIQIYPFCRLKLWVEKFEHCLWERILLKLWLPVKFKVDNVPSSLVFPHFNPPFLLSSFTFYNVSFLFPTFIFGNTIAHLLYLFIT